MPPRHLAVKPKFFKSAAGFRLWLEKHHASSAELFVGFHKRGAGGGLTYSEALDEALCFGWIDGVRKRQDDDVYTIRFTPRRAGSTWSVVNIRRARALEAQGRMRSSGLRVFRLRDETKTRLYSYERERARLDPALEARLQANAEAAGFFEVQPPGYKKIVTFWIMSAKRPETRDRRLQHLIDRSARGARIDMLNPAR